LRSQLQVIQQQQLLVAWRDYVYEHFRDKSGKINERLRKLVLDLSVQKEPYPLAKLDQVSPRMAGLYATKTQKTIRRDVAELLKANLIRRESDGYVANKDHALVSAGAEPEERVEEKMKTANQP
jgi:hypothetical protein